MVARAKDPKKLLDIKSRRLQKLREQEAYGGINTDPSISLQIEDLEKKITEIESELRMFPDDPDAQTGVKPGSSWEKQIPKISNTLSKELLPVSQLFDVVDKIKPILYWFNRSVPSSKAQSFLSALQRLWHGSRVIKEINGDLTSGMDSLLRPISTGHFLTDSGRNYVQANLHYANRKFSAYFKGHGFEWRVDDFDSDSDIQLVLYYLEKNAELIERNKESLDWNEANVVRLIRYIVSYCNAVQPENKYVDISEGFVSQAHVVIETFLKNEMGYVLPEPFDDYENRVLHTIYDCHNPYGKEDDVT